MLFTDEDACKVLAVGDSKLIRELFSIPLSDVMHDCFKKNAKREEKHVRYLRRPNIIFISKTTSNKKEKGSALK